MVAYGPVLQTLITREGGDEGAFADFFMAFIALDSLRKRAA